MTTRITHKTPTGRDGGIGNVNPTMIRERAAELAVADGRPDTEVKQQDLDRAEEELRAEIRTPENSETAAESVGTLQPDEPVGSSGRAATTSEIASRPNLSESLVQEGIDEAVHDEMVESGKETIAESREDREPHE